jgi:drug/metabolite transporter (DMT)-like permease
VSAAAPGALFVVLWSSGYVVGAIGVDAAAPFALLSLRFGLAALVAVPLALRVPGWRSARFGRLAAIGLTTQVIQFGGCYSGLALGVHPALAALVMLGLSPLASTAIAGRLDMEHPTRRTWIALGLGALGVGLSVAPEVGDARVGLGVALTVVGMLGLVAGTVLQKRWGPSGDLRVSAAVQAVTATAVVVPITALSGGLHLHPSAQLAWSVAWLAWPLSIGAAILLGHLLSRHDVSLVSALLLVVPASTTVLALLLLGDVPHPLSLVGMAVTLVAVRDVVVRRAAADPPPDRGGAAERPGTPVDRFPAGRPAPGVARR